MKNTPTKRRRKAAPTTPTPNPVRASLCPVMLDLLANFELQHGHHAAAERLAWRAAAMREGAQ